MRKTNISVYDEDGQTAFYIKGQKTAIKRLVRILWKLECGIKVEDSKFIIYRRVL